MTDKVKRDEVASEMQKRLYANRDGRLLPAQWLDLATEPLVVVLLLTTPALILLGPRMGAILARTWWLALLLIVVLYIVPVVLRAIRYARAPVHFATLYGGTRLQTWRFWKTPDFHMTDGTPVRFKSRLAPQMPVSRDRQYIVYYLDDPGGKVLLSYAPADHENIALWMPNKHFDARFARRTGKSKS